MDLFEKGDFIGGVSGVVSLCKEKVFDSNYGTIEPVYKGNIVPYIFKITNPLSYEPPCLSNGQRDLFFRQRTTDDLFKAM